MDTGFGERGLFLRRGGLFTMLTDLFFQQTRTRLLSLLIKELLHQVIKRMKTRDGMGMGMGMGMGIYMCMYVYVYLCVCVCIYMCV